MQFLSALALAVTAAASPLAEQRQSGPSVTIKNGTVVGSSQAGIDSFKGIPFAQPPVGSLRLKPPQTVNKTFGTLQATQYAPSCINTISQLNNASLPGAAEAALLNNPLTTAVQGDSEDCLYLNVQRPTGTTSSSKLPVVVWIYGGGFSFGSTSMYDASRVISRSVELDAPILYVNMAYRLNGYGFMPGEEVRRDGSTNLGLRDQRKAMEWVVENVAAFGGDPDKIVIWGESAGSISVFDQFIVNGGQNTFEGHKLFRGGIMNSGSVIPTRPVNATKAQQVYDAVTSAAGCNKAADSLECLRSLPTEQFTTAIEAVPGIFNYQSLDLAYLPRPDPTDDFFPASPEDAEYGSKVPIIIGDQQDEGTLFSLVQYNTTTSQDTKNYIASYFPDVDMSVIDNLVNAYPDDPSDGSPFDTGILNNIYPEYKRMAAILGDITFNLIRRAYLANVSDSAPAWSYLNTYLHDVPVLGTLHGADIEVLYGPIPTTYQSPIFPIDYYISFFNYLDPNKLSSMTVNSTTKSVNWPQWKNDTRQMLEFARLDTHVITDNYRPAQYNAILQSNGQLRV